MDNFLRKELCLSKYKAYNLGNFSTFAAILKILHPQCIAIPVRTPPGTKAYYIVFRNLIRYNSQFLTGLLTLYSFYFCANLELNNDALWHLICRGHHIRPLVGFRQTRQGQMLVRHFPMTVFE